MSIDGNLTLGATTLNAASLGLIENVTPGQSADGKVLSQSAGGSVVGANAGSQTFDIASHDSTSD